MAYDEIETPKPSQEEPPLENKGNVMVQEIVETPLKQPKQLMRDNEKSDKKSPVKFDETKNIVKEFAKNEKIINFTQPKHSEEELKP